MTPPFADPLTARLAAFLDAIGVPTRPATLDHDTFLPGLELDRGELLIDESRLAYPGDLLHEGGHVAVAPPDRRRLLTGDAEVPGLDMETLEHAVVPWSYAAALHLKIDPALVFHPGGYRGRSESLLRTFSFGVHPGAHLLEEAGMCATGPRARALGVDPFPHMLRWLRP